VWPQTESVESDLGKGSGSSLLALPFAGTRRLPSCRTVDCRRCAVVAIEEVPRARARRLKRRLQAGLPAPLASEGLRSFAELYLHAGVAAVPVHGQVVEKGDRRIFAGLRRCGS